MANFTDALRKTVAVVAPGIATALGGPLAGAAVAQLTKALNVSEDDLEQTVLAASPDVLLKIKTAELEFQKFLKEADIKLLEVDNEDRANARNREIQLRDWTPSVLSGVIVAGFFIIVGWMLKYGLPAQGGDALLMLLGTLGSGFIAVLNYYFGSSAGSRNKQFTIDAVIGKK